MSYVLSNIMVDIIMVTTLQMRKWWVRKTMSSVFSHSIGEWQRQDLKEPRAAKQLIHLITAQVRLTTGIWFLSH